MFLLVVEAGSLDSLAVLADNVPTFSDGLEIGSKGY